jgi:hypothetical protein
MHAKLFGSFPVSFFLSLTKHELLAHINATTGAADQKQGGAVQGHLGCFFALQRGKQPTSTAR